MISKPFIHRYPGAAYGIGTVILLCVIGHLWSVTGAEQPSNDGERTAIRKVMQRFVDLWNKDEAKALTMLFIPDGEFIGSQGTVTKTRSDIQTLLTKEREEIFQGTDIAKWIDSIDFEQPDRATASGTFELSGVDAVFGLVEATGTGTFSCTFIRRNGEWMIKRAQITRD